MKTKYDVGTSYYMTTILISEYTFQRGVIILAAFCVGLCAIAIFAAQLLVMTIYISRVMTS